ncbi:MAG TPA: MYXO-CTERM sorting domain-containing protein [Sandaracinaceae bacterium LLY-WYZ-13_1]|nr:MYXO-CTERM sorting domain-containing protein [Sandaracinaceae bacterium LLY-WYZ-13_1]
MRNRLHRLRTLCLGAALGAGAFGAASAASAQDIPLANGSTWDIDDFYGDINDGGQDSFDSWGALGDMEVFDGSGSSLDSDSLVGDFNIVIDSSDDRRAVSTDFITVGDVETERTLWAPADTNYLRYFDRFTNTSTETRTVVVVWGGDLGSDTDTLVAATSSGDLTFDTADTWGVTIDADSLSDPADDGPVGYAPGSGAALVGVVDEDSGPGSTWSGDGDDDIAFHYEFDIPAGETRYLMYFLYVGRSETAATAGTQVAETRDGITALAEVPDVRGIDPSLLGSIVNWTFAPGANGDRCFAEVQCASAFCVDGVCCDTACGGGDDGDCQVCSTAAGGTTDGTCGPAAAGTVCRPEAELCDAAETCDGTALTCPTDEPKAAGEICRPAFGACDEVDTCDGTSFTNCPNAVLTAGEVCRPSAGACDLEETCTGTSVSCPADAFEAAGTECRAAAGECDLAEACTGASATCPPNARRAAGVVCRESTGPCDAAEVCDGGDGDCPSDEAAADGTDCSDGMVCNGMEVCMSGTCMSSGAPDCDDGDVCTADMCVEPGGCASMPIDGCCRADADCNDGDPCTADTCTGDNVCTNEPIEGCGMVDAGPADDAGVEDAGVSDDAAVTPDAGDGDGGDDGGCRAAPGRGAPATGLALLLGALAFGLRRRRRR